MRKAERKEWERKGYVILEPTEFTGRREYVMVKLPTRNRRKFSTVLLTIVAILIMAAIMAQLLLWAFS
jgi:hypothetical protein